MKTCSNECSLLSIRMFDFGMLFGVFSDETINVCKRFSCARRESLEQNRKRIIQSSGQKRSQFCLERVQILNQMVERGLPDQLIALSCSRDGLSLSQKPTWPSPNQICKTEPRIRLPVSNTESSVVLASAEDRRSSCGVADRATKQAISSRTEGRDYKR